MKANKPAPNPTGKTGKPITLQPMSFDEAVRKMLGTPPPPKEEAKGAKKKAAKKEAKESMRK